MAKQLAFDVDVKKIVGTWTETHIDQILYLLKDRSKQSTIYCGTEQYSNIQIVFVVTLLEAMQHGT